LIGCHCWLNTANRPMLLRAPVRRRYGLVSLSATATGEGRLLSYQPEGANGSGFNTSSSARSPASRLVPLAVLLVLVVTALGAFFVTRNLVIDQEQRLLREKADEVAALLANAFGSIESSLRTLGTLGASSDPAATPLFAETAAAALRGSTVAVGVAADGDHGFVVVNSVGDGAGLGQPLVGDRAALAARALSVGQLVSALLVDQGETRLVFALSVGSNPAVAYQESIVNPATPVPSTPESPFRELRVALYASTRPDPSQLVVTTEADMPMVGNLQQVPFPVGADSWLLLIGSNGSLTGSFAQQVPWLLLAGGVVTALLAAAVAETLARRRSYALSLVAERTGDLESTLGDLAGIRAFLDRMLTAGPVFVNRIELADRRVTYVSPNIERLLGLSENDALAPGFLTNRIDPEDLPRFAAAMNRLAEATSEQETLEYRFRHGDGAYRWISVDLTAETDETDQAMAVLAYSLNVDDRRRADIARGEAEQAAETANHAKSAFISRMSHELRTPLNAVLGFGQLLEADKLTDDQHDSVDHILKAGRHLLDLINEVLDISRIEAGELALSPEPVLVSDLIQEAVDLMRPAVDQRGIQLVVDRSGICDCFVLADRQRAKQILLNLLSNAVKYNRARGTIALSCQQQSDARISISVADTGHGIAAERLGLLFVPFERLGAEGTDVEGTGIGLALSKRLAEAMGGTIGATSTLGQGSIFSFELPRVEGPVERYERLNGSAHTIVAPAARRHRVLHIEDNMSNLKLVERIFAQRPDVEVIAALHGSLGLELAREHDPALILLDLHLPDIGGEQVLQRLRDDPVTASIPVVIVSADATSGQIQRLLASGASSYITKPIDVRELLSVFERTINGQARP
jgi:PAS domain S-box-containing protein